MSSPASTIPVPETGNWRNNSADGNSSLFLTSAHLLPAPEPYSADVSAVYFYNCSLSDADIVCGASNRTLVRSCCHNVGVRDTYGPACRLRGGAAAAAAEAYWLNCSRQLAAEHGAGAVEARCWRWPAFLAHKMDEKAHAAPFAGLGPANATHYPCGSVGNSDKWGYTHSCCEAVGARSASWIGIPGRNASSAPARSPDPWSRPPDVWAAQDCWLDSDAQEQRFNACLAKDTWMVCNKEGYGGAGGTRASLGLLLAAAALALVV